ncbi:hypothetical protein D1AOALGA4SA_6455 [Olavius algarvensis Delta 1 endosymbiont]|nr:hypothetical protein D1AOALGA4SA_6455 [Olavius algarvensis Delta 1 endosymbiont]
MSEDRGRILEVGSRTRRRPVGLDYAAAKDAEVGLRPSTSSGEPKSENGIEPSISYQLSALSFQR